MCHVAGRGSLRPYQELNSSQADAGYQERVDAVAPFVEAVVANGVYEIVVDWTPQGARA